MEETAYTWLKLPWLDYHSVSLIQIYLFKIYIWNLFQIKFLIEFLSHLGINTIEERTDKSSKFIYKFIYLFNFILLSYSFHTIAYIPHFTQKL